MRPDDVGIGADMPADRRAGCFSFSVLAAVIMGLLGRLRGTR
ncbi:hypothetical protein [Microlunatus parietis]|uniref:Uncharacterized protein n=1 Tax=Microlunatus parietis TaxID=682979 RepID=A0A7Y9I289_9ACTN|nr:hypothetical protein [Microlunatus parietis]NYE68891.1 hypothetical protein [Microlunatus parietis]